MRKGNKEENKKINTNIIINYIIKDKKNILIFFLILMIIILTIFLFSSKIVNSKDNKQDKFLSNIFTIQDKLSYYIGKTSSGTFGVYDNTQIVLGTENKTNENSNNISNITAIANSNEKLEKNGKIYYKIIGDNINKVLNITLPDYEGMTWYIEDGKFLKVKIDTKPEWWTDSFDSLSI